LLPHCSLAFDRQEASRPFQRRVEQAKSRDSLSHLCVLQNINLENSLGDVEARYKAQMEQLNGVLLHLESELAQTRAEGQRQAQEYEALLNIKVKLEAEIATYRRLLEDGEDFR
jgi:hypothetical protein